MKKAVITTGGKQYLVSEGETIEVELLHAEGAKTTSFEPLLVIDGETISVGTPNVDKAKVTAEIVAEDIKADKVTAIRYKAKKRVHKVHGHRQHQTQIKITKIA
ncbi:MAG TPA: 50S ribosomal protein L21 [Patescibacteria group bacterium]|nr:50S ribosomal protein L21 [Patescibacteria group bacterium]